MVAERIKHFPQFRPGEAPVYESLAFYFDANRDYVSAYFCVSMAIHWANHGGSGVLDSKAFVEEMAKRREKLRRLIEFEGAK